MPRYASGPGPKKPNAPDRRPAVNPDMALTQKTMSRGFKKLIATTRSK
ncbi:MAG: hypothetical protein HY619_03690 [Thaumarchaeota archaeon]|nr:hypothetical protein [Nitrososphaerota archaeon]